VYGPSGTFSRTAAPNLACNMEKADEVMVEIIESRSACGHQSDWLLVTGY
jgi:hypothetical protein